MRGISSLSTYLVVSVLALVLVSSLVPVSEAVDCNALQLSPCAGAITSRQKPSPTCCSRLNAQVPCLCGYMKNPALRPYVNSPNAQFVASSCGVATPKC